MNSGLYIVFFAGQHGQAFKKFAQNMLEMCLDPSRHTCDYLGLKIYKEVIFTEQETYFFQ